MALKTMPLFTRALSESIKCVLCCLKVANPFILHPLIQRVIPHIGQILLYIISGVVSNLIDILGFYILIWTGIWYVQATFISGAVGFVSAFAMQKYIVFKKHENSKQHFIRYCILGIFNIIAISIILYLCVEQLSISEEISKIIANGSMALWNFVIMKKLIYI